MNGSLKTAASRMMRAIRVLQFGGPEALTVQQAPIPQPNNDQMLVRVRAAGVNPVDTYIRTGTHTIKPDLPYTPGNDGAGIVEKIGDNITQFKVGDRVCFVRSTGSYAEYALASEPDTVLLDDKLSFQQGAAVSIPYMTAYRAIVARCNAKPGETVFIHGASGAVGLAACQISREIGLQVIGTAGTEVGMKTVRECGATTVFNHRDPGYVKQLQDFVATLPGQGFDVIIEMLANVNLETDLKLAARHGRIGIVGNRGTIEITPRLAMTREVSIIGVMLFQRSDEENDEVRAYITRGQQNGWLKPSVALEYKLEDAGKAHVEVMEHSAGSKGKIVLSIDSS